MNWLERNPGIPLVKSQSFWIKNFFSCKGKKEQKGRKEEKKESKNKETGVLERCQVHHFDPRTNKT